ncbi:metallophosphoesterase [Bacillus mojavensis]
MRSYTNKDGEKIVVSEEHLRTAVAIKQEFQKASPSRRASWKKIVEHMEKEGFYDAENSENYRCMLKSYQKSIGELPEVTKHADMVASGKLESIKELVGEIAYENRNNQNTLRQLNKTKRDIIDYTILAEHIGDILKGYDWSKFNFKIKSKVPKTNNKMIACLSDLHIGAKVDTDVNKYSLDIAADRLERYANKIITEAKDNHISEIHIINLGDVIEHSNMRQGQAFDAELSYSDQIVIAADLIMKFIHSISSEGFKVKYAGIAGNHDRTNGDKDKNITGDHAVKPINKIIKTFIENANIGDVEYIQAKDYEYSLLDVNGLNFKFVHGDLDSIKNEGLVARHSDNDNIIYNAIVMGHYHHYRDIEVGQDKRIIVFGSMKGTDNYSKDKLRKVSPASQGIIIINENKEIHPKKINLQEK